jgi:hypothetical protein
MQTKHFGWGNPTDSIEKTRKLSRSAFDMISKDDPHFKEFSPTTDIRRYMGWWATRKLLGKDTENYAQLNGSCTSFGMKNAVEYLEATEIILKQDREEFKPISQLYIWGAGRKLGGYRTRGEGAYGIHMVKAVMNYGTIARDMPGLPNYSKQADINFSGPVNGKWLFEDFSDEGKKYKVNSYAKISTWDELVKAICNGYFCTIASDQGFEEMKARSDGFHYPVGQWPHQMSIIGVDDTYKIPYGIILNSWGDVHGKLKDFETGEDLPVGVLRVRADVIVRMMQDECYVISDRNGFPTKDLTREMFNMV